MALGVIRELVTRLGFQMDDAEARRYEKRLKRLGTTIRGVGRSLSLFVTAPIVALGASFIKAAADAEETENKFRQIFKGIEEEATATAGLIAKDFDLANVSVQEMVSSTGSLLVGFGFTRDAALDMADTVARVAADISSLNNVQGGAARASTIITKALLGETEGLKALDTAILQEDVKKKIAILTSQGMTFETNKQAKAFATLQLIIDQNRDAIGDYAKSQGSATNQTRRLIEKWKELSITLGKVLLPLYTDLVKVLSDVVEWLNSFSPAGRKAIVIIAGIAAALGPLLIVLGGILTILAAIPVLAIAAVAAVAAIALLIGEDINAFLTGRKSVFGLIVNASKQMFIKIFAYLGELWDGWIKKHVKPWVDRIEAAAKMVGVTRESVRAAGEVVGSISRGVVPFGPVGGQQARQLFAPTDNSSVVNLEMTINAASGMSEGALATQAAQEVQRLIGEAKSRGATTPRMAP